MIGARVLAALAAALALGACGEGLDRGNAPDTIRFSILATGNAQAAERHWEPVLADMETATGLTVKPYVQSDDNALVEAMRFRRADVGRFSNRSGLEAVRRADGEVFARTTDPSGADGDIAVLIVRRNGNLTLDEVLKCDGSLTLGIGDARSIPGRLAPMTYLFAPRGIDPEDCFETVRAGDLQANLRAVADGDIDVAASTASSLRQDQARAANRVKIIWRSPRLPEDPIVYRKDLDPAVKEKLRQFFLTYGQGEGAQAERQRRNLAALSIGGFMPADDTHLLPVREMEATEAVLKARASGNKRAIDKAEDELDGIRQKRIDLAGKAGVPLFAP